MRENLQPLQMLTEPGNGCTCTSTLLPEPGASGRALERHKHPVPASSREDGRGSRETSVVQSCLVFPQPCALVRLEGEPAKGS